MPIKRLAPNRAMLNQIRKMVIGKKTVREISKLLRINEDSVKKCVETKAWTRKKLPRTQVPNENQEETEEMPTRFERKPKITT